MWRGELPQELVLEILIRLPVQPLLRFRCVSKAWRCLIDSADFVKSHFSNNPNSKFYLFQDGEFLAPILADRNVSFAEVDFQNCSDGFLFHSLTLPVSDPHYIQVVGSCHGLICISTCLYRQTFLVNPSTREYRLLPPICKCSCEAGLGYDSFADEYKLVLIPKDQGEVYICGSKSNTWREVNVSFKYKSFLGPAYGKYCHGALHWIVYEFELFYPKMGFHIVAFDIANEEFTANVYEGHLFGNPVYVTLEVCGGRLCLGCAHHIPNEDEGSYMDVWVMEEYGVRRSWCKLVSFDRLISLVAFSNCGRRLLFKVDCPWPCNCSLHWYDLDKKSMECTNTLKLSRYDACLQSLIRLEEKLPYS